MAEARDTYVYRLKDSQEIVYIGITYDLKSRMSQHSRDGKKFNNYDVLNSVPRTRGSAEKAETEMIHTYQKQHGGRAPKYNTNKRYF